MTSRLRNSSLNVAFLLGQHPTPPDRRSRDGRHTFASKTVIAVPLLIDDGDAGMKSDCVEPFAVRGAPGSERSAARLALGVPHQPAGAATPQFG
jgi:hypothetical protein